MAHPGLVECARVSIARMSSSQAPIWELPDLDQPVAGLDGTAGRDPEYAAALGW